jgi:hypothetical protein
LSTETLFQTTAYETTNEQTTLELEATTTANLFETTSEVTNNFVYNICAGIAQLINCNNGYIFVNQAFYGISTNPNVTCTYRYFYLLK